MLLTVLTPSYNRGEDLQNLFQSLCNQTDKRFTWLVVDDGSTDNTRAIVRKMVETADFPVRYLYKENGGKHTALNLGLKQISTELTFIADSDDALLPHAVETIYAYHRKYEKDADLCGYAFLRRFTNGQISGKLFSPDELKASYIETRINSEDTMADKAEVFRTACLKEFPFPEYPNERFLGEDIVWVRMARKYSMIHINEAIYEFEYLEGGLTRNRRKHNIASPLGCMNRAMEFMHKDIHTKYRIKSGLQYIVYGMFAGIKLRYLLRKTPYTFLTLCCTIPGLLIYAKWKKAYK